MRQVVRDELPKKIKPPRPGKPPKPPKVVARRPSTAHLRAAPISGHEWRLADPCSYCGGPATQWDHIEPLYRGGEHAADNLTRACWSCNRAKNTQPLLMFLTRQAKRRAG